jgi:hypothetical protein
VTSEKNTSILLLIHIIVQGVLEVDAFLVTRGTTHYSEEF